MKKLLLLVGLALLLVACLGLSGPMPLRRLMSRSMNSRSGALVATRQQSPGLARGASNARGRYDATLHRPVERALLVTRMRFGPSRKSPPTAQERSRWAGILSRTRS
jgi:hypothetical protein